MDKTTVVDALIVVESILVTLLLRFDGSVPGMYWGSLTLAAISLVLFLVGLSYLGGTVFAAVALILLNLATGLVPNSVSSWWCGFIERTQPMTYNWAFTCRFLSRSRTGPASQTQIAQVEASR